MERFIEVDEVIANACTLFEEVSDELTLVMRQWVWWALRSIGPSDYNLGVASINIVDGSAKKPVDMTGKIKDLSILDCNGRELDYRYNYSQGNLPDKIRGERRSKIDIYEDNDYIHFGDFDPKPEVVHIKYFKLPIDDCGMPLVPEDHLNAIIAYLTYMYYLRKGNNYAMIGMCKNEWNVERDRIRSKNRAVYGIQAKQIMKEWMSLLPNQRYNRR